MGFEPPDLPRSSSDDSVITNFVCYTAPSSPPINFRVTGVTSRALSLQWDEPVLRHRNGIILRYQVNLVARETSHTYEVFTRSVTVTSLHPYYTYNCTVSAITVAPGPSSSVISVQTYQDG